MIVPVLIRILRAQLSATRKLPGPNATFGGLSGIDTQRATDPLWTSEYQLRRDGDGGGPSNAIGHAAVGDESARSRK